MRRINNNQRLTRTQKEANDFQWYKEQADELDTYSLSDTNPTLWNPSTNELSVDGLSEKEEMLISYNLFNNILNIEDLHHVINPYGASEMGTMPAKMVNRDIISGKVKAILGMEAKRPFDWKVLAVNPEATTRKETEQFDRLKEFVLNFIREPEKVNEAVQAQEQKLGRPLSGQEKEKVIAQIEQETMANAPDHVKRYMEREHQDPAEIMSHQLLEYEIRRLEVYRKFNAMLKHGLISGKQCVYIGIMHDKPIMWNVNSLRLSHDYSNDQIFIEEGDWAACEYRMTPSQIVNFFNEELTDDEIDEIYEGFANYRHNAAENSLFATRHYNTDWEEANTLRVLHCTWKSLRKVGFLTYLDSDGVEQMRRVDESYSLNLQQGDLNIDWYWIPEVYETWKIGADIYKRMQPVPGQIKSIDNLYDCRLPYYGVIYDNVNARCTSLVTRMKDYQYLYNTIMYRVEMLIASDKGKKILMNINAVPTSIGIDLEKWQHFFESSPFTWFNPQEEGMNYSDVNTIAKVLDLSLVSDINRYIELAEYIKNQAGESVGITKAVEGQIGPNEAVNNTRQNLVQSSHILEPYFELHNHSKQRALSALLEVAKIAYHDKEDMALTYVLDDMSQKLLRLNMGLLNASTLGIFIGNTTKAEEIKQNIVQLAHAALQNQKVKLSDMLAIMRQSSIVEAEATLKASETESLRLEMAQQQSQVEQMEKAQAAQAEMEDKKRAHEKEVIVLKEEERRETEIAKIALTGMSYNPDTDNDDDGVNDFLEIAREGVDADIKQSKAKLDREKFEHQKEMDKKKLALDQRKAK